MSLEILSVRFLCFWKYYLHGFYVFGNIICTVSMSLEILSVRFLCFWKYYLYGFYVFGNIVHLAVGLKQPVQVIEIPNYRM